VLIGADGLRSTVRRQIFPDVDLVYAGYVAWRGMVEEAALTPSTHAAIFHRFGWGLLDRQHILGYPVPGPFDDPLPDAGAFGEGGEAGEAGGKVSDGCRAPPNAPRQERPPRQGSRPSKIPALVPTSLGSSHP
jgi:hypothetical protein